ncbi:MAG: TetR/AcrR family transcriptional regulator [Proteobacteria bacterium]|nr:TetR/AcrR family transcriptional regulator [Pseudomonadota bacterium]
MGRPGLNLREQNMRKRRDRLLTEARTLLTLDGFEALNLRELARLAEVTVPTIYNLIGNKEEVLVALFAEVLTEIEARIRDRDIGEPLARAGAVAEISTALFAEDENYYRSAFLAVEYLNQSGAHHDKVTQIYAWGERMTTDGVLACQDARLLRGRIPPALLGELILRSFRTTCREWAFAQISLEEFRRIALVDIYITLAADAVPAFQSVLVDSIAAQRATSPTPRKQRPRRSKE